MIVGNHLFEFLLLKAINHSLISEGYLLGRLVQAKDLVFNNNMFAWKEDTNNNFKIQVKYHFFLFSCKETRNIILVN